MSKFAKTITIIVVSFFVAHANLSITMASADEIVQYHLDTAKVRDAWLHKWRDELSVQITLDEAETAKFAKLTKNNVGKLFQVVLDDQVLIEAVVRAEIDSGSMSARVSDEAEAELLIRRLVPWQEELRNSLAQAFQTSVEKTYVDSLDYRKDREYPVARFTGEGSLKKVPNPYKVANDLFLSDGWIEVLEYMAEKAGSLSRAYQKGDKLCMASVSLDVRDSDDESDHVMSIFWFTMDCRGGEPPLVPYRIQYPLTTH